MTTGSLLLATALLLIVAVYIFRPLLVPNRSGSANYVSQRDVLSAEIDALLSQIKSIDFDFETGKLEETPYQRERYLLMQQTATAMRQLDQLPEDTDDLDARIEAAIKALRANAPLAKKTEAVCPNCSKAVGSADAFCRSCGEKLA